MRNQLATFAVGGAIALASTAAADDNMDNMKEGGSVALTIQVVNLANVEPDLLNGAEQHATAIYQQAGVHVTWKGGARGAVEALVPSSPPDPAVALSVELLSARLTQELTGSRSARQDALGAAPTAGNGLRGHVYVFYDDVRNHAMVQRLPIDWVLAHVMAHELGHLLLPVPMHTLWGIMRPGAVRQFGRLQLFTTEQAALIRQNLARATDERRRAGQ